MFAKLATTLAIGRRDAWRPSGLSNRHDDARCAARAPRRPVLLCRWTLDPASGRPICTWQADEAGSPAAPDRLRRRRPAFVLAAAS